MTRLVDVFDGLGRGSSPVKSMYVCVRNEGNVLSVAVSAELAGILAGVLASVLAGVGTLSSLVRLRPAGMRKEGVPLVATGVVIFLLLGLVRFLAGIGRSSSAVRSRIVLKCHLSRRNL